MASQSRTRRREDLASIVITLASRTLMLRDALLGVDRRLRKDPSRVEFFFPSGTRRLAAVFVPGREGVPAVLLCHGIGETVCRSSAVQAFLAERGIGSLVFNYSGFGKSSGAVRIEHFDEDLRSAHAELRRRAGPETPVFVLGFSLGSGIAASGAGSLRPSPAGLFLCEAFTSFREAVCAAGAPAWLANKLPDIWDTVAAVQRLRLPVCVIHCEGDRLFPLEMPRRIFSACAATAELVVVPGLSHSEPYIKPTEVYWGTVVEKVVRLAVDHSQRTTDN